MIKCKECGAVIEGGAVSDKCDACGHPANFEAVQDAQPDEARAE